MSSLRDSRPPDPTPSPERLDPAPLVDPAARTAEMPMPGGQEQMDLIKICQEDGSLYPMCLELQNLADRLEHNQILSDNQFAVVETVKALRRGRGWRMYELLHSMPHDIIQSIVQGTVAFDYFNDSATWLRTPDSDDGQVPGIYVVGLSRVDKRGWFLNIKEVKKLIKGIKRYIAGYKTISKHISSVNDGAVSFGNLAAFSVQERDDVQFVALVDGDADKFKPGHSTTLPKWVTKDDELPRFDALLRTYERMCDEELDPTGLVRMRQSPLYVGCSKDLRKRMRMYNRKSLKGTNRHLGLTIDVLAQISLSVVVHVRPVLLIWKKDQLPLAEQLITTIAGSLVYQYGFNAIETGGTGSNTVVSNVNLASNARMVMSALDDMRINVRETLTRLEGRKQFLGRLREAQQEATTISETMQACVRQVSGFPNDPKWNHIIDEMNEIAERMQKRLDDRKEALRQWQLLLEIERMLVSPVGRSHP
ncbi:Hypothetical protein NCS54_00993100 [Fusarium falciforme]|uniref:Hypothetical protein n=1 Tax=Fusarium falciforme TaxID=195108 RepID=UPI002301A416|nr:Hypothetical protein NCS54_00993100 [Fusarium falciforme]WAO92422.1 Hypothetical protein NCS54_00993100 [Fusarium falciforme]